MSDIANVFEIDSISNAINQISGIKSDIFEKCDECIKDAQDTLEETQNEEQFSKSILDTARAVEEVRHAVVIEIEVRLAAALAELAAVTPDPIAMAAVSAEIAHIESELVPARQEYNEAVQHREALEQRHEMAVKCVNIAQERFEMLQMKIETSKINIESIADCGCVRLNQAYNDIVQYLQRMSSQNIAVVSKWFNEKHASNEVIKPNVIRDRLDVSDPVVNTLLEYLYVTDVRFRNMVNNYCQEIKNGNVSGAELKIKKNMVGRLCEEIVIHSFKPFSTKISTQGRESLPDGSYTKVDMYVEGLTNPIILGRGDGMGAREGGSLAVEVKSGHSSYLYSQMNHMRNQAVGHENASTSCVICTRDIHKLPSDKENELRESLRESGSPIIGMLPEKDTLDKMCIDFVKEKTKNV